MPDHRQARGDRRRLPVTVGIQLAELSRFVAHARKTGEVDAKADPNLIGMLVVSAHLTV
jgi:hypothetical protein